MLVDRGEGLLGLGRRPGSLVARWCSGLARVVGLPNQEETHRREFESPPGYHLSNPSKMLRVRRGY